MVDNALYNGRAEERKRNGRIINTVTQSDVPLDYTHVINYGTF